MHVRFSSRKNVSALFLNSRRPIKHGRNRQHSCCGSGGRPADYEYSQPAWDAAAAEADRVTASTWSRGGGRDRVHVQAGMVAAKYVILPVKLKPVK